MHIIPALVRVWFERCAASQSVNVIVLSSDHSTMHIRTAGWRIASALVASSSSPHQLDHCQRFSAVRSSGLRGRAGSVVPERGSRQAYRLRHGRATAGRRAVRRGRQAGHALLHRPRGRPRASPAHRQRRVCLWRDHVGADARLLLLPARVRSPSWFEPTPGSIVPGESFRGIDQCCVIWFNRCFGATLSSTLPGPIALPGLAIQRYVPSRHACVGRCALRLSGACASVTGC